MKEHKIINHGMGIFTEEQHADLLKIGAITCNGKIDQVRAEYPKLMVKKGDEYVSIDMGGDLRQIQFEMEAQQSKQTKCHIEYFPKAWTEYWENYKAKKEAEYLENEAQKALVR